MKEKPQKPAWARLGQFLLVPHERRPDSYVVPGGLVVTRQQLIEYAMRSGRPLKFIQGY